MICVTAPDGRYLLVNRGFASFVGLRPERLVGKRPDEAHGGRLAQALLDGDAWQLAGSLTPIAVIEETVEQEGRQRDLLISRAALLNGDGKGPVLLTVLFDTTESRALKSVPNTRADSDGPKTEFLHNMSHELRTPLNAIIGFSQVIAGEMLGPVGTPKYVGYARDILDSAERLLEVINDVLDLSRLESGTLGLVEEIVDISAVVADLLKGLAPRAESATIRLAVRSDGPIPHLRADARKLKQIVLNVLSNAIKFSRPGGVVDVILRNLAGAVLILVEDRGIGMDPQEIELAMTRFGQVATPWSRKHDGIGVGLPLAIGLAELHDAKLTIDSVKGAGTTVTIAFPRERSEPVPGSRPAASAGLA